MIKITIAQTLKAQKSEGELRGKDYLVTGPAVANFGFAAQEVITFGRSSWTIYPDTNFGGKSKCMRNSYELTWYRVNYSSVIRGCGTAAEEIRQSMLKNKELEECSCD